MYDEKVYIYVRFGLKGFEHMSEYICVLCKKLSEKENVIADGACAWVL